MIKCIRCLEIFDSIPTSYPRCPSCSSIRSLKDIYSRHHSYNFDEEKIVDLKELASIKMSGIHLEKEFKSVVGRLPPSHIVQLSGARGSGKSTFLASVVLPSYARNGRVLINNIEEHFSVSWVELLRREEVFGSSYEENVFVTVINSASSLFNRVMKEGFDFVIIDSVSLSQSKIYPQDLDAFVRESSVGLSYTLHATKDEMKYKGDSAFGHIADVDIWFPKFGEYEVRKNRFCKIRKGGWRLMEETNVEE